MLQGAKSRLPLQGTVNDDASGVALCVTPGDSELDIKIATSQVFFYFSSTLFPLSLISSSGFTLSCCFFTLMPL